MTHTQVKDNLVQLLEQLPHDKAELLLDFAAFLKQQPSPHELSALSIAERELVRAEDFWFSLPKETRHQYLGKIVAVSFEKILDADSDLSALRRRVSAQLPAQTILYIEADAEREPMLVVRSPHLA